MTDAINFTKLIKSKGFWTISVFPSVYKESRLTKQQLKTFIESCAIEKRGWPYPAVHESSEHKIYFTQNGIEAFVEFMDIRELWRLTTSINFLHLYGVREDWRDGAMPDNMWLTESEKQAYEGKKYLGVTNTLYFLTEIFEFCASLIMKPEVEGALDIEIKLEGMGGRVLYVDERGKVGFSYLRESKSNERWEFIRKNVDAVSLVQKQGQMALEAFTDLALRFNWDKVPHDTLVADQKKLLTQRG